jgi:hypothetical protein
MTTRYNGVLACFKHVDEDKEKPSKIILRCAMDNNTVISLTVVEARATPEIVSVNSPVNPGFIEGFDEAVLC